MTLAVPPTLSRGRPSGTVGAPRLRPITLMRPWEGPAPDPRTHPEDAKALQRACARYISGGFLGMVLLQRFATPGMPELALLLPLLPVFVGWGLLRGIVELDRSRLMLWLAAAGSAALAVLLHLWLVALPYFSLTAYGLFFAIWVFSAYRVKDRRPETFRMALAGIARVAGWLALACVVFIGTQLSGVPYRDYMADALPKTLLLQDFVITYPIVYGSPLYRANAWIGLEPSFVSMQLGLGLVAAFLSGTKLRVLLVIILGLVASTAGSGFAIVAVALIVMLGYPVRNNLVRYLPLAVVGAAALMLTPFGQSILSRLTEAGDSQSSTSLRGITPYAYLWPRWVDDLMAVLWGRGPGSSQTMVSESGITGLLVPSPAKIFVEYGLIAGVLISACLLYAYVGGPSRSLSVTLLVSLWMLQPGTTTILAVLPLFLTTTWWAPRTGAVLESDTATYATARRWVERAARWRPMQTAGTWRMARLRPGDRR